VNDLEILVRVALAMLLGAIIGFERELADKPAGLRTHMLVAGAAALLVGIGGSVIADFTALDNSQAAIRADPIRIIQSVIIGVSFLGAGTIIRERAGRHVEGLTTAATLLFVSVIGVCAGLGELVLAVGATGFVVVTVAGLKFFEKWLERRRADTDAA
jgi:putative Mg2+ transporter-C (MgtC) family protein